MEFNKRKTQTFIFILLFILLGYSVYSQIYMGTVEGFITNSTGHFVQGADVNVTVSGCSGNFCSGKVSSDSGGYYVVTNLDIIAGDSISVAANKSNAYGSNTGVADDYQAAEINITIVQVPFSPTITTINDTHNNTFFVFNWTSGIDPEGLTTYDDWTFDGTTYSHVTSPQNRSYLNFIVHTWSVKTCNIYGCSSPTSDSFNVYNTAPPIPVLQNITDTTNTSIEFNWTSGGADPEGDTPTYFEFKLDSDATETNATPPINKSGLSAGSHTWKVRECDDWECSNWATDTFTIINNPPTLPNITYIDDNDNNTVNLEWISGTDPDADTTYDYLVYNNTVLNPATSPFNWNLTGIIEVLEWKVRTCDNRGACSNYVNDSFIHYVCPAPAGTE